MIERLSKMVTNIEFSHSEINKHREMLEEKVFQTKNKWPHFRLLLDDVEELSKSLNDHSTVVSLERGLLYGGLSLLAPFFTGHSFICVDCSPRSANERGSYNQEMVNDKRLLRVTSALRTDISDTTLPNNSADLLIIPNLVHHIEDQNALFNEAHRILKPSGKIYVFEPLVRELHQIPDDFLRYTPYGLKSVLADHNFENIKIKTEGGPFSAILYCWVQAVQYFPEEERKQMEKWLYDEEAPKLLHWDAKYDKNLVRKFTEFPMGFSLTADKN